ncbi:uncharacterized protein BJ171DRAFT_515546, partial [Polychytrium aggregatum]|uniref:uncharacterized protein n=1 Tax=Polychytrium aggregatum TaxID=110093 RepID=UPI0022FDCA20
GPCPSLPLNCRFAPVLPAGYSIVYSPTPALVSLPSVPVMTSKKRSRASYNYHLQPSKQRRPAAIKIVLPATPPLSKDVSPVERETPQAKHFAIDKISEPVSEIHEQQAAPITSIPRSLEPGPDVQALIGDQTANTSIPAAAIDGAVITPEVDQAFNDFNFWRPSFPSLDLELGEAPIKESTRSPLDWCQSAESSSQASVRADPVASSAPTNSTAPAAAVGAKLNETKTSKPKAANKFVSAPETTSSRKAKVTENLGPREGQAVQPTSQARILASSGPEATQLSDAESTPVFDWSEPFLGGGTDYVEADERAYFGPFNRAATVIDGPKAADTFVSPLLTSHPIEAKPSPDLVESIFGPNAKRALPPPMFTADRKPGYYYASVPIHGPSSSSSSRASDHPGQNSTAPAAAQSTFHQVNAKDYIDAEERVYYGPVSRHCQPYELVLERLTDPASAGQNQPIKREQLKSNSSLTAATAPARVAHDQSVPAENFTNSVQLMVETQHQCESIRDANPFHRKTPFWLDDPIAASAPMPVNGRVPTPSEYLDGEERLYYSPSREKRDSHFLASATQVC